MLCMGGLPRRSRTSQCQGYNGGGRGASTVSFGVGGAVFRQVSGQVAFDIGELRFAGEVGPLEGIPHVVV